MRFDDLSKAQQRLLIDLVSRGYLFRVPEGWEAGSDRRRTYHGNRTMRAIVRFRLCLINTDGGWAKMGSAVPSRLGRAIIDQYLAEANAAIVGRSQP